MTNPMMIPIITYNAITIVEDFFKFGVKELAETNQYFSANSFFVFMCDNKRA